MRRRSSSLLQRDYSVWRTRMKNLSPTGDHVRVVAISGVSKIPDYGDTTSLALALVDQQNVILDFRGGCTWHMGATSTAQSKQVSMVEVGEPQSGPRVTGNGVDNCNVGDATVLAQAAPAPTVGHWYFLYDKNKQETGGGDTRNIGGELVRVKTVGPYKDGMREIEFESALSQSYENSGSGYSVILSDANDRICENITILGGRSIGWRDMSMTEGQQGFHSCIRAGYTAGLKILNAQFENGWVSAVAVQYSRDTQIKQCAARNFAKWNVAGTGYTFLFDRTVNATMEQCHVVNSRYGVSVAAGAAGWAVAGLSATMCSSAAADIHGGDCFNGQFRYVDGGEPFTAYLASSLKHPEIRLGNPTWKRGASQVAVEDCTCQDFTLEGPIRDTTISRLSCARFAVVGASKDANLPTDLPLQNVTVEDSAIEMPYPGYAGSIECFVSSSGSKLWVDHLQFINCTVSNPSAVSSVEAICLQKCTGASEMVFTSCSISLPNLTADAAAIFSSTGSGTSATRITFSDTETLLPNAAYVAKGFSTSQCSFRSKTSAGANRRTPNGSTFANLASADVTGCTFVTP